jgi:hypothetical protein
MSVTNKLFMLSVMVSIKTSPTENLKLPGQLSSHNTSHQQQYYAGLIKETLAYYDLWFYAGLPNVPLVFDIRCSVYLCLAGKIDKFVIWYHLAAFFYFFYFKSFNK